MISGMSLTPLKKVRNENGSVFHILKSSDSDFSEFGEAYFSSVVLMKLKVGKSTQEW